MRSSWAIPKRLFDFAAALAGLVVLFYVVTLIKLGGAQG